MQLTGNFVAEQSGEYSPVRQNHSILGVPPYKPAFSKRESLDILFKYTTLFHKSPPKIECLPVPQVYFSKESFILY